MCAHKNVELMFEPMLEPWEFTSLLRASTKRPTSSTRGTDSAILLMMYRFLRSEKYEVKKGLNFSRRTRRQVKI